MITPQQTPFLNPGTAAPEENYDPLIYTDTLKRMEPGLSPMDTGIALASIAVSLKDISVTLTALFNLQCSKRSAGEKTLENLHNAINGLSGTPGAIINVGAQIATELRVIQNTLREKS